MKREPNSLGDQGRPAKRVALVGLGRMGLNHLRVLKETPGLEVAAVVEAQGRKAPPLGDVPFLRSVRELASVDFDAAVIATPTPTHRDIALELLAMGKHLLVEKPLAGTFAQGVEILRAADEMRTTAVVGHVERFNPAVRKLIQRGLIGTPIHFAFTRVGGYPDRLLAGNNVILDLAVHDLDVIRTLVGPVRLEHSTCHVTSDDGVFDTAEILLLAGSGATAAVHVNWITPTKIRTIRVTGTRGVCFCDYILQTCEIQGGGLLDRREPDSASFEAIHEVYCAADKIHLGVQRIEPLRAQAEQFRALLETGEVGELCAGKDALAAVLLAERALQIGRDRAPLRPAAAGVDGWV
jgi:UDP-N-acetylglucosamine 3-dehydrogenase